MSQSLFSKAWLLILFVGASHLPMAHAQLVPSGSPTDSASVVAVPWVPTVKVDDAFALLNPIPEGLRSLSGRHYYSSGGGAAAIVGPTAFVYRNEVNSGFSFALDGATTGGVTRPDTSETGSFLADNMTLGNGFLPGGKIVRYKMAFVRVATDLAPGLADMHVELWDGDPLGRIDSAGLGYAVTPIAGSQASFLGVPSGTSGELIAEFPGGLTIPNQRVWMLFTATGCSAQWVDSLELPTEGTDDPGDFFQFAIDDEGVGTCCHDDSVCDETDEDTGNDCPETMVCGDRHAETAGFRFFGGDPFYANFYASIEAEAQGVYTLRPVRCEPPCMIIDNTAIVPDPPARVFLEMGISGWSTEDGKCTGSGMPCRTTTDCAFTMGQVCVGGPERIQIHHTEIALTDFTSGVSGSLTLVDDIVCGDNFMCEAALGAGSLCDDGLCQPAFIDETRFDLVTQNIGRWCGAGYRATTSIGFGCQVDSFQIGPYSDGSDKYTGTIVLDVEADARGTFEIKAKRGRSEPGDWESFLTTQDGPAIPLIGVVPAKVRALAAGACCFNVGNDPGGAEPPGCADALTPTECEAQSGFTVYAGDDLVCDADTNGDGVLDVCECLSQPPASVLPEFGGICQTNDDCDNTSSCIQGFCYVPKNRYVSFSAPGGGRTALRVTVSSMPAFPGFEGTEMWVGEPTRVEDQPSPLNEVWVSRLVCSPVYLDWSQFGVVHIGDDEFIANSTYDIQVVDGRCDAADPSAFSAALSLPTTQLWSDLGGAYQVETQKLGPPDGIVDARDMQFVIEKFRNVARSKDQLIWADIVGTESPRPDMIIDFIDIQATVKANLQGATGGPYPFVEPDGCP